jgi:hypothetical protein
MIKLGIGAVAVLVVGFLLLHRAHDSKAERTSSCLEKTGASVQQSTFVEDVLSSGAAEQGVDVGEPLRKLAADVDKNLYEVRYGDSSALLVFTKGGRAMDEVELRLHAFSELGGGGPATRYGNVLVLWPESPSDEAAAAVEGCLS